jgi:hypothetical protein
MISVRACPNGRGNLSTPPAPPHPRTWRGAVKKQKSFSRRDRRPSFASPPSQLQKGSPAKGAERREAHPTMAAPHRQMSPSESAGARQRALSGRARLPALRRGTRRTRRIQYRLSSSPAFPETKAWRALPAFTCHSLPSSSETGRGAGRAVAQSRPGAVCETARGHRPRSTFRIASGMCPSRERGGGF